MEAPTKDVGTWLTYAQAARHTGWSIRHLRNLVSGGPIPVYGRPRVRRFRRDMLDLFLTNPDMAMRKFLQKGTECMAIRKLDQSWQYDFTLEGHGRRKKAGFRTKAEAGEAERRKREELRLGRRRFTLAQAFEMYLSANKMKDRSRDTCRGSGAGHRAASSGTSTSRRSIRPHSTS